LGGPNWDNAGIDATTCWRGGKTLSTVAFVLEIEAIFPRIESFDNGDNGVVVVLEIGEWLVVGAVVGGCGVCLVSHSCSSGYMKEDNEVGLTNT
jgi:hypothetical protein